MKHDQRNAGGARSRAASTPFGAPRSIGIRNATSIRPCFARLAGAALALAVFATPASAVSIVGQWGGQWQTSTGTIQADFDLKVVGQTSGGALQGVFSWTCTAGIPCSGLEIISGTIDGAGQFSMATVALVQPVLNIASATYAGSAAANSLSGFSDGVNPFSATLISTQLPPGFDLAGSWSGTWRQPAAGGITADYVLAFTGAVFDGTAFDLTGYFDWTCTSGIACGGREFFDGRLLADRSMQLATTGFGPGAFGLAPANYALLLYEDTRLLGLSDGVNLLTAVAVVPEPSAWSLLALGLLGIALAQRRPTGDRSSGDDLRKRA